MRTFLFTANLQGSGDTAESAWNEAVAAFAADPGKPATTMACVEDVKELLDDMSTPDALWWFIENIDSEDARRSELFFHLRERFRQGD